MLDVIFHIHRAPSTIALCSTNNPEMKGITSLKGKHFSWRLFINEDRPFSFSLECTRVFFFPRLGKLHYHIKLLPLFYFLIRIFAYEFFSSSYVVASVVHVSRRRYNFRGDGDGAECTR